MASFGPGSEKLGVQPWSMGYWRRLHLICVAVAGGIWLRRIGGAEGSWNLNVILLFVRSLFAKHLLDTSIQICFD
ncbi:hypothetical protein PVAP13_9KG384850 [Panicum virgatum]|uniref:Uncharacterized protein n=1 Tax=Panicum virgatum TaxID=38727 RepID=A0A8T0NRR5_PANVG|nr:hypothetical protein PVAP13_9KG384850 [Panicum virgatum]